MKIIYKQHNRKFNEKFDHRLEMENFDFMDNALVKRNPECEKKGCKQDCKRNFKVIRMYGHQFFNLECEFILNLFFD